MKTNKRKAQALKKANLDLFERTWPTQEYDFMADSLVSPKESEPVILPSEEDLVDMFDRINVEMFGGRLPQVKILYSDRMLIAGSYLPTQREIRIGRKYHTIFPADLEDTLRHEMIHIVYPNHSREFKNLARHWGVSLKAREHPKLRSACRYIYYCPVCGKEYPRRKRLRMASCGDCTPGKDFDPRFKLKLLKSKKKS